MNPCPKCGSDLVPNPSYFDIADCPKCDEGFQGDPKDARIAALEKELEEAKAATEQPALSCLCCGRSMSDKGRYAAVQHLVFKSVVICQECKGSSEHYSHVLGKYHLADKALIGARMERDAALSQVCAREAECLALMEALRDYGRHTAGIPELGIIGCAFDPEEGIECTCGLAEALSSTSATAQEWGAKMKAEAVEEAEKEINRLKANLNMAATRFSDLRSVCDAQQAEIQALRAQVGAK